MKTKTLKLIAILLFMASMAQAQGVAIGDKDFTPNAAAILDVQSQNKGMLVPIGSVIMWVGTPQTIPSGWRIMSEMIGRFPVGAGTATGSGGVTRSYAVNENQDASGETGQEFVTLTEPQIPPHSHEQQVFSAVSNGGRRPAGYTSTADDFGGSGYSTKETGGGGSHENRPPFRALYFIEKVSE